MITPATADAIHQAAMALSEGRLVGMPTETVYGIAARFDLSSAVADTFRLKGRPPENPLIVHVASLETAQALVSDWPVGADELAAQFWPGPLTLVLPRSGIVSDLVTGGGNTVAVRMPEHPVALRLISAVGVPLTAPSANAFMRLSPTRAQDIDPVLAGGLAVILDGGDCEIGIESTVVSLTDGERRVLRPGVISAKELGAQELDVQAAESTDDRRSPGTYRRHYAPRMPIRFVDHLEPGDTGLSLDPEMSITMPHDARGYAARLYAALHECEERNPTEIVVQRPPDTESWAAIWDRLRRAAAQ